VVADGLWFSADPREVDSMVIGSIQVLGTWRAGEPIYRA